MHRLFGASTGGIACLTLLIWCNPTVGQRPDVFRPQALQRFDPAQYVVVPLRVTGAMREARTELYVNIQVRQPAMVQAFLFDNGLELRKSLEVARVDPNQPRHERLGTWNELAAREGDYYLVVAMLEKEPATDIITAVRATPASNPQKSLIISMKVDPEAPTPGSSFEITYKLSDFATVKCHAKEPGTRNQTLISNEGNRAPNAPHVVKYPATGVKSGENRVVLITAEPKNATASETESRMVLKQ